MLEFSEYGSNKGKLVVYFHGAPGSPEECSLFDKYAKEYNLNIICFNRFSIDPYLTGADYYQHLAEGIKEKADGEAVDLVGFSIGCHVALEVSYLLHIR